MNHEAQSRHLLSRFEKVKSIRQSRDTFIGRLPELISKAKRPSYGARLTALKSRMEDSAMRCTDEIQALEPQVRDTQARMAETYLKEDRTWQRSIDTINKRNPAEASKWLAEYQLHQIGQ